MFTLAIGGVNIPGWKHLMTFTPSTRYCPVRHSPSFAIPHRSPFPNFPLYLGHTMEAPWSYRPPHGENPENREIFEKWAYFSRKILKNGYPFLPKTPLKIGRGFEARAAHPCPTQIWVPPPETIFLITVSRESNCKQDMTVPFARARAKLGGSIR